MPRVTRRSVLSGILVKDAMRSHVVSLDAALPISSVVRDMIRHKVNAVLVVDAGQRPVGIVSKTDIMGAFYAGLPKESPIDSIMVGPPLFCYPDDQLESALEAMHRHGIHRLYVMGADKDHILGTLAYPDIIGLMYRYCRNCKKSRAVDPRSTEIRIQDVMTGEVAGCRETDTLATVVETLSAHRFGALLVTGPDLEPVGVLSKTDLVLAYRRDVPLEAECRLAMARGVITCADDALLYDALQTMLVRDVQRIFVHRRHPSRIIGVLSLSDAARFRSGSCRACISGRMIVKDS